MATSATGAMAAGASDFFAFMQGGLAMALQDSTLRPHHTAICVNDFERAKRFYIDFVGFKLEDELDQRDEAGLATVTGLPGAVIRWAMLVHGTHRLELFKYYTPQGDTQPRRQCDFGYSHFAFQVDDVDAVYAQVKQGGYETLSEPQTLRGGRSRVFYVAEPEGAITEFAQFGNINVERQAESRGLQ